MTHSTHKVFSIILAYGYWSTIGDHHIAYPLLSYLTATLPDLDHPLSTVSKGPLAPFSKIICHFWSHRTITHSLLGLLLISLLLRRFIVEPYSTYLIIGYGGHLIGDFLTDSGICLFYPIKVRVGFGIIKTGGKLEKIFKVVAICFMIIFMLRKI